MTVLYFAKASEIGPSSRYRIFQYLPLLETSGVRVLVKPLFRSAYFRMLSIRGGWLQVLAKAWYTAWRFIVRSLDILSRQKADLIVVEGPLFPYAGIAVERWLAKRASLIVELDDAIYLTPGQDKAIPALLKLSAGAIVGNTVLADYARAFTPNVHVVPTVVDTSRFTPRQLSPHPRSSTDNDPVTIGWIGLDYNVAYVKWLTPVFKKIQAIRPVRIKVICGMRPIFDDVNVEFCEWAYDREVEDLRSCDIGIMPLPDNEWTRGKCGLKLLQYMSLGMVAVASPVGVNREIIQDGVNGFLASTEEEWHANLLRLCEDSELRARIGTEARKMVVDKYSLAVWAPRLIACYREILEKANGRETMASHLKTVRP